MLFRSYVLHDFAKSDADWLEALMRGISEGAPSLATGDDQTFMNAVSLRTAPPRSSTSRAEVPASTPKPRAPKPAKPDHAAPDPTTPQTPMESRSPMQRLIDKFR